MTKPLLLVGLEGRQLASGEVGAPGQELVAWPGLEAGAHPDPALGDNRGWPVNGFSLLSLKDLGSLSLLGPAKRIVCLCPNFPLGRQALTHRGFLDNMSTQT